MGRAARTTLLRCAVSFALASAVLTVGGAPSVARATTCDTDVVFYAGAVGDATRLGTELAKFASPCADYYISLPPLATGLPRGGIPLAAIHALGPRFHAMAELRLTRWQTFTGRTVTGTRQASTSGS